MPAVTYKQIGDGIFGLKNAGFSNTEFASIVQTIDFDWKMESKQIRNGDSKTVGKTYYDASCEIKLTLWATKDSTIPCLASVHTLAAKIPNLQPNDATGVHDHGVISSGIVESVSGKGASEEYVSFDISLVYYPFLDEMGTISTTEPVTIED